MRLSTLVFLLLVAVVIAEEVLGKKGRKEKKGKEKGTSEVKGTGKGKGEGEDKDKGKDEDKDKGKGKDKEKSSKEKEKSGKDKSKPKKEKEIILNGFIAETTVLPLVLRCSKNHLNLKLGSVTCNSKAMSSEMQIEASDECEKSKKDSEMINGVQSGPSCAMWFKGAKKLKKHDTFRAVYQCYMAAAGNWTIVEETQLQTASEKKGGKNVKLMCKHGKALFKISSVKINGAAANTTTFPELSSVKIEMDCFIQAANELKKNPNKKMNFKCEIENKKAYGGTMEIAYSCQEAPSSMHEGHGH